MQAVYFEGISLVRVQKRMPTNTNTNTDTNTNTNTNTNKYTISFVQVQKRQLPPPEPVLGRNPTLEANNPRPYIAQVSRQDTLVSQCHLFAI